MENDINEYIYNNPHSTELDMRYALYDIIWHQWNDQIPPPYSKIILNL